MDHIDRGAIRGFRLRTWEVVCVCRHNLWLSVHELAHVLPCVSRRGTGVRRFGVLRVGAACTDVFNRRNASRES